jgi:hypothetical protein
MKTIISVYFSLGKFLWVRKKLIKFHVNTEYFFLKSSVIKGLLPKKLFPQLESALKSDPSNPGILVLHLLNVGFPETKVKNNLHSHVLHNWTYTENSLMS